MTQSFDTPILFVVFNRPEQTRRVFQKIKEIRPRNLFFAADGPRSNNFNDLVLCKETRLILEDVDWECDIRKLYSESNLGCGLAVSTAITWFFKNVEQGIILEDDCMPSISFFIFCEKLLNIYSTDYRIWHIAGYNCQDGVKRGFGDYYFSQETPIWGWASWRRVWLKNYNIKLEKLPILEKSSFDLSIKHSYLQSITALHDFRKVFIGKIDTWDYQYAFYQLINNGLSIIPNVNLVQNIGFDSLATHTLRSVKTLKSNLAFEIKLNNLKHPSFVLPDLQADKYTYNKRTSFLKKVYVLCNYLARKYFNM